MVTKTISKSNVDVTLLMPCLNEETVLAHCIRNCHDTLKILKDKYSLTGEILISDNGSTDLSVSIAIDNGARVVSCPNKGYGNALRYGIEKAHGRIIVMGDADGSYDFSESIKMVEKLENGFDLCMGSRFKGEIAKGAMPWKNRYIGNPVLTGILNLFFKSGLSDAHCGLRAFTKKAILEINPNSTGMEFASEIVIKASLLKLKATEVPITLHKDLRQGKPHLRPWRDGWRHLRYLVMLSPQWLFFIPAILFSILGSAVFTALLSTDLNSALKLSGIYIGTHWSVIAGGLITSAHISLLLGISTYLISIKEGYRKPNWFFKIMYRFAQLENMLITGLFMLLAGIAILAYIIYVWSLNDFGPLDKVREMVLSNTLFIMGIQNIFSGFLIANILTEFDPFKNMKS